MHPKVVHTKKKICHKKIQNRFQTPNKTFVFLVMEYFGQNQRFKSKNLNDRCMSNKFTAFHKTLNDGLESFGLLVDYCDVFISCLDSHSDGTHSLQRIHR